jgi:hypothetical protein
MSTLSTASVSLRRAGNAMSGQMDTIVRFHDVSRLMELERCVFSLIGQSYRPLNIILATQRFSDSDTEVIRTALTRMIDGDDEVTLTILNWDQAEPKDARSELLNLGLRSARGRYLSFLDYDDVLYPEAYELLVSRLKESRSMCTNGICTQWRKLSPGSMGLGSLIFSAIIFALCTVTFWIVIG